MKRRYYLIIFVILFGAAVWGLFVTLEQNLPAPVVSSTTPLQPETPATAPVADDDVIVSTPIANQTVISPLVVSGQARGSWFFEGSFPIALVNDRGAVIASGAAKAIGNWQTSDYVPFSGTLTFLTFNTTTPTTGYVVLKKDNPSGNAQFDKSTSIKVQW